MVTIETPSFPRCPAVLQKKPPTAKAGQACLAFPPPALLPPNLVQDLSRGGKGRQVEQGPPHTVARARQAWRAQGGPREVRSQFPGPQGTRSLYRGGRPQAPCSVTRPGQSLCHQDLTGPKAHEGHSLAKGIQSHAQGPRQGQLPPRIPPAGPGTRRDPGALSPQTLSNTGPGPQLTIQVPGGTSQPCHPGRHRAAVSHSPSQPRTPRLPSGSR